MGHTPGPWEFDGVCQIVEEARPHMRVAFLPSDHYRNPECKHNGMLLSAAPDLLAALKALLAAVKDNPAMQGRDYVGLGIQVNDAIKKAEG